jgi:hypothetical protein
MNLKLYENLLNSWTNIENNKKEIGVHAQIVNLVDIMDQPVI